MKIHEIHLYMKLRLRIDLKNELVNPIDYFALDDVSWVLRTKITVIE